jgi:hypothetical protein
MSDIYVQNCAMYSDYINTGLSAVRNIDIIIKVYSKSSRLGRNDSAAFVLGRHKNCGAFVLVD